MDTLTTLLLAVLILSVWGLIAAVVWLTLRGRGGASGKGQGRLEQTAASHSL
jgi:hypothetical protein